MKEIICIEVKCLAEMMGVTPQAIYKRIYAGRLPCIRFTGGGGQERIGVPVEVASRLLGMSREEIVERAWQMGYPVWRCRA